MDRHGLLASFVFTVFLLLLLAGDCLKVPTSWLSIFNTELMTNNVERTLNYHVLLTNAWQLECSFSASNLFYSDPFEQVVFADWHLLSTRAGVLFIVLD